MRWGRRRPAADTQPLVDQLQTAVTELQQARATLCAVTARVSSVVKEMAEQAEKDAPGQA